ncbi:hypothetical protein [Ornithinimicrobium kibberense]|jgi:hypothetical protein|uniref:Uncharacterized protein n=1 Tax=Ornithinimicrobium kibberense TaxID=282060 RepID=A0ABV5UZK6_9MICO|nr:hypothetical protein [Ornithinimicrobium kibberense]
MNTNRRPAPLLAATLLAAALTLGACGETAVETPVQQADTVERPPAAEPAATPHPSNVQEVPPADLIKSWPAGSDQGQVDDPVPGRSLTEPSDRLTRHVL